MTTTDQLYKKVGTRYKPTTLSEQRAWGWRKVIFCDFHPGRCNGGGSYCGRNA